MPELVGIIDTGVLCCWLEVPGKETANSGTKRWDNARANTSVDEIITKRGTLVLPNSVIIETANHIAQAQHSRRIKAEQLFDRVISYLDGRHPWQQFVESGRLWTREWFDEARQFWPAYADQRMGLADYSIASIAQYFNEMGSEVRTLTTDASLEAKVGHLHAPQPRRRRR